MAAFIVMGLCFGNTVALTCFGYMAYGSIPTVWLSESKECVQFTYFDIEIIG